MFVSIVVCLLVPRFELLVALGDRRALLRDPVALAPVDGGSAIGEVSAAAEAFAVRPGMPVGEAFARCPRLGLIAPDPDAARIAWHEVLCRLEQIGAAVESSAPGDLDRVRPRAELAPGVVYFDARGLERMYGGLEGVLAAARRAVGHPVRVGVAGTRFCALQAARAARPRRSRIALSGYERRALLGPLPVGCLRERPELDAVATTLERLGVTTLDELGVLGRAHMSERFGAPGLKARDLAHGIDTPLRPRPIVAAVFERIELHESAGAQQLEYALGLLIERLLARAERAGRTLLALGLGARFAAGGSWRDQVVLRDPTADPSALKIPLVARIAMLPEPIDELILAAEAFGPPAYRAFTLFGDDPAAARRERMRRAIAQAGRATGMPDAVARVVRPEPGSRLPERRIALEPGSRGGPPAALRPRPIAALTDARGSPVALPAGRRSAAGRPGRARDRARGYVAVIGEREQWLVEDRWWTGRAIRRHYFELVLEDGGNVVVFRDLTSGRWFEQRA